VCCQVEQKLNANCEKNGKKPRQKEKQVPSKQDVVSGLAKAM